MRNQSKISRKKTLALLGLLLLLFFITRIQASGSYSFFSLSYQQNYSDTIITDSALLKLRNDTGGLRRYDMVKPPATTNTSIINAPDSTFFSDTANVDSTKRQKIDSLLISKDSLDSPIDYAAEDSGVLYIESKKFFLYGKANAKTKDVDLTANNIQYDQSTQLIKAFGGTDTANNPLSKPTFVQGDQKSISDTIEFNLKTQRGLSRNSFYNEGEIFVNAERIKKVDKDVAFAYKSRFTTCNLDTPHFAFVAKKMKLINNKIGVSGPVHPEFEGVPIPLYVPFGIYPLNRGRHSGLLPAQFANNSGYGLGLEGLGYYKVINDNWDVTMRGNIYSYGGWTLNVSPEYYKRYRYRGSLNLEIQHAKVLNSTNSGFQQDEFTKSQNYAIRWSHAQDSKAHPGVSFSANVNASSTPFNRYVADNPVRSFQNQLSSSISYSKTYKNSNLTLSLTHNQNNNLHLQNIRFPTLSYTVNTFYPFEKKEQVGTPKWYEKLGISYNGQIFNQFSFYDTAFNFKHILDTLQWGAQHSIPISISLPALGPFIVSPFVSYNERWFGQKSDIYFNPVDTTVDTTQHKGYYQMREVSFGASVNTRIFGTVQFPHSKGIVAIRHEIKPTVSFSYKPDLVSKWYDTINVEVYTKDAKGIVTDSARKRVSVSKLGSGNLVSPFSQGQFGGVTFSLENLLEMKVRNKKDTTGENPTRKVKLIDGLNFTTAYNFLADSFRWSNIAASYRSTFFQKVNVTGSASFDPYETDKYGYRIDELLWKHGRIGRLTTASLALSTSIQSKKKDGKTDDQRLSDLDQTMTPDEEAAALAYVRSNPAEFVDFDIPWSLNLSMTTNFSKTRLREDYNGYYTDVTASININGDFSLTPKWKIGGSTYFDLRTRKIGLLTMYITREMHCWQLAINLTPVGITRSFSIVINPKSSLLRDLKINRTRSFTSYP